jgi:DNA-binding MarR family transcriptional regulator
VCGFSGGKAAPGPIDAKYIVLRYNCFVPALEDRPANKELLQALAEFRHRLRLFLHFSESAAEKTGLQPQQHQLLLQIAGAADGYAVTVGYLAERMGLRHNSTVELCNRSEEAGLLSRRHDEADRRCVLLEVTSKGRKMLESLSIDHARELNELGPELVRALTRLKPAQARRGAAQMRRVK